MASVARRGDAVVVANAVMRALVDLACEWPGVDESLEREMAAWPHVGGVTLDLLAPSLRPRVVEALLYACRRAVAGERAAASKEDAASGDRLVRGAQAVMTFLLAGADDPPFGSAEDTESSIET